MLSTTSSRKASQSDLSIVVIVYNIVYDVVYDIVYDLVYEIIYDVVHDVVTDQAYAWRPMALLPILKGSACPETSEEWTVVLRHVLPSH